MCNYENGDNGFCNGCDTIDTTAECVKASFANSQTKDCLDKCVSRGTYTGKPACVHFYILTIKGLCNNIH